MLAKYIIVSENLRLCSAIRMINIRGMIDK